MQKYRVYKDVVSTKSFVTDIHCENKKEAEALVLAMDIESMKFLESSEDVHYIEGCYRHGRTSL